MCNNHIEISPSAGAPGAEAGGVDVAWDLDGGVICFREIMVRHLAEAYKRQRAMDGMTSCGPSTTTRAIPHGMLA